MKHPAEVNILPMYLYIFISSFSSNLILLPPIFIFFSPQSTAQPVSPTVLTLHVDRDQRGELTLLSLSLAHDCKCRLKILLA